ncbi:dephospho-CoA kinase [Saccharibacillus kuerlensis]|uniref:Dephospho-CoA kinase n=1 Tax=Saccharibacillus kuerlensis TaxID=459527 RepID=A0ABQ2KT03_9BACL|nr:dephospho-CoA kinase [Saccharibacillus kuerlensis]GGN91931.1 dephospho-CoA kinase [Saccharibacillus kuerlensis]
MRIGLTGGIATGKSTVSRLLEAEGVRIVDADVIARNVMNPGQPLLEAVAKRFGPEFLLPEGGLDRRRMAEHIFNRPEEREALNAIVHPAIRAEIRRQVEAWEAASPNVIVAADIPLLYESGLEELYEKIVVVYVPQEVQRSRLMLRDKLSPEQADSRLNSQLDIEEKKHRADYVIDNSGSMEDTKRQVEELLEKLRSR